MPDKPGTVWHMHKTRAPSVGKTSRSRRRFEDGEINPGAAQHNRASMCQASEKLGS